MPPADGLLQEIDTPNFGGGDAPSFSQVTGKIIAKEACPEFSRIGWHKTVGLLDDDVLHQLDTQIRYAKRQRERDLTAERSQTRGQIPNEMERGPSSRLASSAAPCE